MGSRCRVNWKVVITTIHKIPCDKERRAVQLQIKIKLNILNWSDNFFSSQANKKRKQRRNDIRKKASALLLSDYHMTSTKWRTILALQVHLKFDFKVEHDYFQLCNFIHFNRSITVDQFKIKWKSIHFFLLQNNSIFIQFHFFLFPSLPASLATFLLNFC